MILSRFLCRLVYTAWLPVALALLLFPGSASAATYYIDWVNGNDANNGTSKTSAWKRHPFMAGFAGNYIHLPGDQFILKGGVTWPNSAFPMVIRASGTAVGRDYYGVDPTFFSGVSWTRPVFDFQSQNVPPDNRPVQFSGVSFINFDNIELKNLFVSAGATFARDLIYLTGSSNITIKNCFIHDWTTNSSSDGGFGAIFSDNANPGLVVDNCVIYGRLGFATTSGDGANGITTVTNSTIHDVSNALVGNSIITGNTIYNIGPSFDANHHEDAIQMFGGDGTIAGNIIHDVRHGQTIASEPGFGGLGGTHNIYNNVIWNSIPTLINADNADTSFARITAINIYNNTLHADTGIAIVVTGRSGTSGLTNLRIQNNHYITDYSGNAACYNNPSLSCGSVQNVVDSNNVKMSQSVASLQGYTLSNNFAPTSASNGTVDTGTNAPAAVFSLDIRGVPRPQGPRWDTGAYEFTANRPNPPTNLTAVPR